MLIELRRFHKFSRRVPIGLPTRLQSIGEWSCLKRILPETVVEFDRIRRPVDESFWRRNEFHLPMAPYVIDQQAPCAGRDSWIYRHGLGQAILLRRSVLDKPGKRWIHGEMSVPPKLLKPEWLGVFVQVGP